MRALISFLIVFIFSACATVPEPPQIVQITFISLDKGTVQNAIIDGDFSESFDEPGYILQFESNQEIPWSQSTNKDGFIGLDYFHCNSKDRYEVGHTYSARDYIKINSSSYSKIIERRSNGSILYEVQMFKTHDTPGTQPICAQVFVLDGNNKSKDWQPAIISNKIDLKFPI